MSYVFRKLVDKRKDKVKFKIIPKTNEEFISVRYGCNRFIEIYRFLSSSLGSLVEALTGYSRKTLKDFKREIVDIDEIINIVNEKKILIEENRYKKDSIKDSKNDFPDTIENIEETLLTYMVENDLEDLKTEFLHKWKYWTKKSADPYEFFICLDDYQKHVDNFKEKTSSRN